ncbi:MAG: phosphatase PAP2 family protein, partial [Candidatus Saccharibacteria bacterium]
LLKRFRLIYIIAVSAWYVAYGWKSFLTVDIIFTLLLPGFALYGKGLEYIKRFLPFVAIVIIYDSLRSIVPYFVHDVHFHEMIAFDKLIGGGQIPTVNLQHWLYHGQLHWFDYYLYFVYMLHFIAPFIIGLLLWRFRPAGYWRYIAALSVVSYTAFVTYFLFPAAPPWMASNVGYIDPITKISSAVWWGWGIHSFPLLYSHFNPNATAAIPSLHSAYPFLDLLFINRLFGKKIAAIFSIYPLSIWFGVVYLGEHYVIDVIVGMLYSYVAFHGVEYGYTRLKQRRHRTAVVKPEKSRPFTMPVLD